MLLLHLASKSYLSVKKKSSKKKIGTKKKLFLYFFKLTLEGNCFTNFSPEISPESIDTTLKIIFNFFCCEFYRKN